jgi:hypothetical protein
LRYYHLGIVDQAIKAAASFGDGLYRRIDLVLLVDVQPHALDVFDGIEFFQILGFAFRCCVDQLKPQGEFPTLGATTFWPSIVNTGYYA